MACNSSVWLFPDSPEIPARFGLQAFQVCIPSVTPGTPLNCNMLINSVL